ncbi:regulator of G-protein signaling 9-binding protein B-like [Leucoraja erinacea]|uniref:regulator of G-protein signaling 9-binding protein B-like n=1 Tax=Leucoraja erinaceus TaxID=7782 RepID=UPI0024542937|nr:regulator of G-protein signaling 9-binding protein B-like [Leucoraja erinacea]
MPIQNIRVADEATAACARAGDECKALVGSLNKLTGCYRHLATGIGGSSDSPELRDELRKTRERTQDLAVAVRNKLTAVLRDKALAGEERAEMERLWVIFCSSLELFQVDMSKVLELGLGFPLVRTGVSGDASGVAARALSVQDMSHRGSTDPRSRSCSCSPAAAEQEELREQIDKVDRMVENMEMKVNVLRWTVESKGDASYLSALSNDASSVALLSVDEESRGWWCCGRGRCLGSILFCTAALAAVVLSL